MSAENAWRIAREQIALEFADVDLTAHLDSLPMPPAFRAAVEAEAQTHWYQQAINAREMASAWEKEARAKAAEAEELRGMLAEAESVANAAEGIAKNMDAAVTGPASSRPAGWGEGGKDE